MNLSGVGKNNQISSKFLVLHEQKLSFTEILYVG